jgi:hypothetical protein
VPSARIARSLDVREQMARELLSRGYGSLAASDLRQRRTMTMAGPTVLSAAAVIGDSVVNPQGESLGKIEEASEVVDLIVGLTRGMAP